MYEDFYGLADKPFHLTPDPHFFFASKLHTRALSYLKYGIGQGEGFIVITGAIGTGKTTIANSLLAELDQKDVKAIQIVTPKLNPDDLITVTASKLGVNTENKSKGELLEAIEKELSNFVKQGHRALLIVDEAQNLPIESVEELRMLSNFQIEGKPLLQSFLLGQPELRELLQLPSMEQFRQRIVASCDLKPLSAIETHEYIEFRVNAAAKCEVKLFSDEAIELIYHFTNGIPRRINTVCDRILLFGFLEEKKYLGEEETQTVINEIIEESVESGVSETPSKTQDEITKEELLEDLTPPDKNATISMNQPAGIPSDIMQDITHLRNMIQEIRSTLETSIEYKLKVSRYIDNAINRKLKQLKQMASVENEDKT
ncbi:XrtA/PEP-CTERM system-associated ATPase [Catenovulum sediminis]|uniref:XrtA/PEP-CTERM system-associated ATPase n=1 Tax=Catenovulum sediminis TaxID=1740262 RepID=A0ABV1RHM3_9ALTE